MAEVKDETIDLGESINKAEKYVKDNKRSLTIIGGAAAAILLAYFGYQQFIVSPQEENAQKEMYVAERYFGQDSTNLAIKGDGSFPGFADIVDNYGSSNSGNLAKYYLGMSYLKKGDYDNAIKYLSKYDAEDDITGALALGGIASAHLEKNEIDDALTYYKKAADWDENNFTRPLFLMKTAMVYEMQKNYKDALSIYQQIKKDYPMSTEAREVDKYIGRAEALSGK